MIYITDNPYILKINLVTFPYRGRGILGFQLLFSLVLTFFICFYNMNILWIVQKLFVVILLFELSHELLYLFLGNTPSRLFWDFQKMNLTNTKLNVIFYLVSPKGKSELLKMTYYHFSHLPYFLRFL